MGAIEGGSMNRRELTDMILDTKKALTFYEGIAPNCTTCLLSDGDANVCKRFGPVPADFVAQGCDEWEFDEVPF